MREAPLVGPDGEPITMCFLPTIDPFMVGAERLARLASPAIDEVFGALGPAARSLRVRLSLVLDAHLARTGADGKTPAEGLAAALGARACEHIGAIDIDVCARGAAGVGLSLPAVVEALASGSADLIVIGGVHTDYDPERIAALAAAGRLYSTDNLDALIPGESAAFVALTRADVAQRLGLRPRAELCAFATGHERARPDNEESAFAAMGLTAAIRSALGPLVELDLRAGWMLTDLGFETFRHYELQAALTRTQRYFGEPQHIDSPAQRLGHLDAAAMPLHFVLAAEGFARGFAPHPLAVSLAGSDAGERAVALLRAPL